MWTWSEWLADQGGWKTPKISYLSKVGLGYTNVVFLR